MKKILIIVVLIMMPVITNAATTQTFTATAIIKSLITITETTALKFGTIEVDRAGTTTTITLDTNNGVTQSTGGTNVLTGTPTSGVYALTGDNNAVISVTAAVTQGLKNGTTTLTTTISLSAATVTLGATGTGSVKAGGTVVIPANTPSGTYTGNFTITASY
ncbi:DUF4402 domain-containing protein [Rickettsiales bacterium LUAb2]